MSVDRNTTDIVRSWLREDTHEDAEGVLDVVLDLIDSTPQKRVSWRAWRSPTMHNRLVLGAAAAAIVVAAVGITLPGLRQGSNGGLPTASLEPTPSAVALSSRPSASPRPLDQAVAGVPLLAGRYRLAIGRTDPPFRVELTLPAG